MDYYVCVSTFMVSLDLAKSAVNYIRSNRDTRETRDISPEDRGCQGPEG